MTQATENNVRAAILLSSAMGALETIRKREPKHSKRHREALKAIAQVGKVLDCYPLAHNFDLIAFADEFYQGIDDKLDEMIRRGVETIGGESVGV